MHKWRKKAFDVASEIQKLLDEYEFRKTKFIRYKPTEKELREAVEFYKLLIEDAERGIISAVQTLRSLQSVTDNTEEQIKIFGFVIETLAKYPDGKMPLDYMLDVAEKWDVLDYITEDIFRVLLKK